MVIIIIVITTLFTVDNIFGKNQFSIWSTNVYTLYMYKAHVGGISCKKRLLREEANAEKANVGESSHERKTRMEQSSLGKKPPE